MVISILFNSSLVDLFSIYDLINFLKQSIYDLIVEEE